VYALCVCYYDQTIVDCVDEDEEDEGEEEKEEKEEEKTGRTPRCNSWHHKHTDEATTTTHKRREYKNLRVCV